MNLQLLKVFAVFAVLIVAGVMSGQTAYAADNSDAFITTWVALSGRPITIPVGGATGNYTVDWGDGSANTTHTGDASHTYSAFGSYDVTITGNFTRIALNDSDDAKRLVAIKQWGNISWTSMEGAFYDASNLISIPSDAPDLSRVTNMRDMFNGALIFNQTLNHWNVSSVTDMSHMFVSTNYFNQPLNNWYVSSVTDMSLMFFGALDFNQPLNNWDVSSVTDMSWMFAGFGNLDFNQPLNNWNVSSVTNMSTMFYDADAFNQPLNNWDVSSVTDMSYMFYDADAFNQPLNNWDVSSVTDMSSMFLYSSFEQNLGDWYVQLNGTSLFGSTDKISITPQNSELKSQNPTYALVSGDGSDDNALFKINGNILSLKHASIGKPENLIRINVTGASFGSDNERAVEITSLDVPTIISPTARMYNVTNIIFSGTAPANSMVNVYNYTTLLVSTNADSAGDWYVAKNLADKIYNISATLTIGNKEYPKSEAFLITVEAVNPTLTSAVLYGATGVLTLTFSEKIDITPTSNVNSTRLHIRGPELSAEGVTLSAAKLTSTGSDGNVLTFELTNANRLEAIALITPELYIDAGAVKDIAGKPNDSDNVGITVYIPTPEAPTIDSPSKGTIFYRSNVTVSGTSSSGVATITIFNDTNTSLGNATSSADGTWSITQSFDDGDYSIKATATKDTKTSLSSNTVTFTVDAALPATPIITSPTPRTYYVANITFAGTSSASSLIKIYDDNQYFVNATSDANGIWSTTKLLDNYAYFIKATSTKHGKTSTFSDTVTFAVDTTILASSVITSPKSGDIFYQSSVTIRGNSSYAAAVINIFDDNNTSLGDAISTADGVWSMAKSFDDGDYSIKATATKDGKASPSSNTVSFTVDAALPATPTISSPTADKTYYVSNITFVGTSSASSLIRIYDGSQYFVNARSDANGIWSTTKLLDDGTYSIKATSTKHGKTSTFSDTVTFTVDTTILASSVITSPKSGDIFYQSSVTITGTGSAGATIEVFDDNNTSLGNVTSTADGVWSMTKSFDDAVYSIKAAATKDGRTSLFSDTVTFTVDTSLLAAPIITSPTPRTYYVANITFAGTSSASSLIKIYNDNQYLVNATSDINGVWSTTKILDDGTYSIKATSTKNGRTSLFSNVVPFTITTGYNTVFADINNNTKKDRDEPGIANATVIAVNLKDIQTIYKTKTDENGIYKFENNSVGLFLIQAALVPKDHKPSGDTVSYEYILSEIKLTSDKLPSFSLWPVSPNNATVKGSIFDDSNDNGLHDNWETGFADVNIFVVDFLTITLSTTTTDANGNYSITGVLPDVVLVQAAPIPAGFLSSNGVYSYSYPILPNFSVTTVDFALYRVPAEEKGVITIDVFHDTNENGFKDAGEPQVKDAVVYTFELLTAVPDVQVTGASGVTTHTSLLPDVVLAQINAELLPKGFTKITTSNEGFEYITITKGSMHVVQIGLN